jgi:LysR family transcriptional regulator, glycine cleavage system transcriptional activator
MANVRKPVPLNPMRSFAVASRHPNFTSAARELGVSQVAVSRQIAILEDYLGVQLFERGNRSARLTDMGRVFGQEIAGLFDEIEVATEQLLQKESGSTIKLRVYPSVAHYWLLPRLKDFYALYPGLRVRLDTRVNPLDFRGTHLDAAIQLGNGMWREARSRKLFDERIDVVGSPSYLDSIGPVRSPEDVRAGELLHSHYRRRAWEQWSAKMGVELDYRQGSEFDSSLLTYSAAAQGFGLAVGQIDLLLDEIEAGGLVAPLQQPLETGLAFHVVWPTNVSVNTKTRRFIDWLLKQAGQSPEFFAKSPL